MKNAFTIILAISILATGSLAYGANGKAKLGPCVKQCVQRFNPALADSGADEFLVTDFNMQECVEACNISIEYGECYIWEDDCCVPDYAELDPDCGQLPIGANCSSDEQCLSNYCDLSMDIDYGTCQEGGSPAEGTLDTTFGTDGVVRFDSGYADFGLSVASQSDGKVFMAGYIGNETNIDLAVWKYNSDGTADSTFGTSGYAIYDGGNGNDIGYSVAIQSDGKVLVTGYSENTTDVDLVLVRFNGNGDFDTTFGTNGVVRYDGGRGNDRGNSVAIQSDGKSLVSGISSNVSDSDLVLFRFNTNGTLDTSFGTNGVARYDGGENEYGFSVVIQSDGKPLVAGQFYNSTDYDLVLVRYSTNGTLDTTYGTGGVARYDGGSNDHAPSAAIQPDGKAVLSGFSANATDLDLVLMRFNDSGVLDTSFGTGGIALYDNGATEVGRAVAIQSDGKPLVAGEVEGWDTVLLRYNTDGTFDNTFGTGGMVYYDSGESDYSRSVTIQEDGKVLVSGGSWNGTNYDALLLRFE